MEPILGLSDMIDRYIFALRTDALARHTDVYGSAETQDDSLRIRGFYKNLPAIGIGRIILPIDGFNIRIPVSTFSSAIQNLPAVDIPNVESAMLFVKEGNHVCLSRAKLSDTYTSQNTFLKTVDTFSHAVCLMNGVVATSNLRMGIPLSFGSTRSITIRPFAHEIRRDTTYWAEKFNQTKVVTTTTPDGMAFASRPYGVDIMRPENLFMHAGMDHYDDIPVYDCRGSTRRFELNASYLRRLNEVPQYGSRKNVDIPEGALVTVGYSLTHAIGKRGPMFVPYLLFVLVLGVPWDATPGAGAMGA